MAIQTTGSFPKALWEGVQRWWGVEYSRQPKFHEAMFEVKSSDKAYEEDVQQIGYGLVPVKPEADAVTYMSRNQGYVQRYTHVVYASGFITSEEAEDDNKYEEVARASATALAISMEATRQTIAANHFNRAFSSSFVFGDAVSSINTAHPTISGNQSNALNPSLDFSEAGLEELIIQMMNAKDDVGIPIVIQPKDLIIPPALAFKATRILKSEFQSGNANNDVNAIRSMGLLGKAPIVNPYLTSTTAWFVKTNQPKGLTWLERKPMSFAKDSDFDTSNRKHKASMRFAVGQTEWRGVYGSAGTA